VFHIKLFGGLSVDTPAGPLTGRAAQRRRLALLALLAEAGERGLSREKLVAYLWPESGAERARHLLSDSIYRINQALGGDAVLSTGDALRLDPERWRSDVREFAGAMESGDWELAVTLQDAPFLDGFFLADADEFERWTTASRARYQRDRARALEALADQAEARRDAPSAVRWWRALAADDRYNSRITLRLMAALERAGERAAAVQHARIHSVLVRDDLGVEPDAEVSEYAERLRASEPTPQPARLDREAPLAGADAATSRAALTTGNTAGTHVAGDRAPDSVAAAAASAAAVPPAPSQSAAPPAPPRVAAPRRRAAMLAVSAMLIIVVALAWVTRSSQRLARSGPIAIAVLPFEDLSPGRDQEYFADGITEELIVRLAKLDGIKVVGRTSAFALKGQSSDVREVAARLGVDAVLAGSVRKADDRLRITAQLMNANDGYQLWSDTYERRIEDVFAIQDEISRAIVTRLLGSLAGADTDATGATAQTIDPEAHNLYLQGRYEWHKRTEQGLRNAAAFFARAVERAPGYARAHVGLGDAHAVLGFYNYLPPDEAFPMAAQAARRALQLDATLAEAHATLGYVALYHEWNWLRAEEEFRLAIEMDPGYSTGHQWYANFLTAMGRFDEAEREMRTAQELDPLSLIANGALGWVLYHAGEFERAVEQCTRTLELNPAFELAYLWRGLALIELRRLDEGQADLERAAELSGGSAITSAALARVHAARGNQDEARALLGELERRSEEAYAPAFEIAKVHAALGDRANALRWLERALNQRAHSMVFLAADPQFRELRDDPQFVRLMLEVGLPPPQSSALR
jgi:TolB-like protein/DNA-binding SARP family transcriptional activator/Tfp pilus assembly protein PilF